MSEWPHIVCFIEMTKGAVAEPAPRASPNPLRGSPARRGFHGAFDQRVPERALGDDGG